MPEISDSEIALYEILHNPGSFQEFITPVDERGTRVLPMVDWLDTDHWGQVRLYQLATLPWDHLLPSDIPADSNAIEGYSGVDRASLGNSFEFGGRKTSKSFGGDHDELQDGILRGEESLVTSRDAGHLGQRIASLWMYFETHPLIKALIVRKNKGDPYAEVTWANGHKTIGVIESTYGGGKNYLGFHFRRAKFDEFQLTSPEAWENFHDATAEDGCVVRTVGVSDGRRGTPAHDVRNDSGAQRHVHRKCQQWTKFWTPQRKQGAIEKYGGEDSHGYQTNVLGLEGDPMMGVWDMEKIAACIAILPEDKKKKKDKQRAVICPIVTITGQEIADGREISELEFPSVRVVDWDVWISMDVGQRAHPSIIGIWGLDEKRKPHEWGKVELHRVKYGDQAQIVRTIINIYQASCFGLDTTGGGGDAVLENLQKLLDKDDIDIHIVPVVFSWTVALDTKKSRGHRRKREQEKAKKYTLKYFSTIQLSNRFERGNIQLLYDFVALREFQSELAKATNLSVTPFKYYTSDSDDRIDMMRVLEYMFHVVSTRAFSMGRRKGVYKAKFIKLGTI